jgi:hypothetical protein
MRRLLCVALVAAASMVFAPSAMAAFGLQSFEVSATNQNGSPDVQAGSHPYELTTSFVLNRLIEENSEKLVTEGSLKDVRVELPPGFVGNPQATPRCTYNEFTHGEGAHSCPDDTAVGVENTYVVAGHSTVVEESLLSVSTPVYNVEPSPGIAAELGFKLKGIVPVLLNVSVRTGGDYGLTVKAPNINEGAEVYGNTVTIWGVPAEASHDPYRGKCLAQDEREGIQTTYESTGATCPANVAVKPFLTNPTSCAVPRTATLSVDSWENPGSFESLSSALPELSDCEKLDFSPSITVTPDGTAGSTPTGLNVHLHVPQEATVNPTGLAEADVKDTKVTLPAGVQLSPSAADGLQACSLTQIGLDNAERPSCPEASKIANVKIKTPLLEGELEGAVYLAAPQNFAFAGAPEENPFKSLIAMYLVAEEPERGVLVKLAGEVSLNQTTGQIESTFKNTPQLPFSDLKLEFYGTDRAPLATPALCETYTTETSFTPWSAPESGPSATPSSTFQITSGPGGAPCSDPQPFAPSFMAGTTNNQAGAFSPFTLTFSRSDQDQTLGGITVQMPPGLLGKIAGVPQCPEAQANAGTCGAESLIGHTTVGAGPGSDPFYVGGNVYLTQGYKGAPFGLSIVVPVVAGPFNLGTEVIRAAIAVNPATAQITVTSNPLPTIKQGIPFQVRTVNVTIDRPGFTFNPTNCAAQSVGATITSTAGVSAAASSPFEAANCANLPFAPRFSASTSGKTSKALGASLTVKIGYTGGQANLHKVDVELPKALPTQLKTLNKACTEAQFNSNPAGCPPASDVARVTARTPLLNSPLLGPAYLVSHGGAAFPDVEMVLQGEGVTLVVDGKTQIKKGITYSHFETIPDAPISSFEFKSPQGELALFTARSDLCDQKLVMPTTMTGQNGAVLTQSTRVEVEGCNSSLSVVSLRVKKRTLTVSVYAPGAGKVSFSGKGVSSGSKTYSGREALTFTLKQEKAGKLTTKIKLTYTPSKGKKQTKTVRASFRS